MNYFTALELPTWTTEIQRYINKIQHYTPIVINAFRKTLVVSQRNIDGLSYSESYFYRELQSYVIHHFLIDLALAPVIATTAKDVALYYFQCLKGANRWSMKVTGISHNPITAAVRAAAAELSSAEARVTYNRIGHLVHERLVEGLIVAHYGIAAMVIGFTVAQSAYRAGAKLYRAVYNRLNPSEVLPTILPSVDLAVAAAEIDQALHLAANIAEAKAIAQANAEVIAPDPATNIIPDFWAEPLPTGHTPPIVGPIWNPAPGRDMHTEVARLLKLQYVPLMLAPGPVVEQPAPKPKAETKAPRRRAKAKAEVGPEAKKGRARAKAAVE